MNFVGTLGLIFWERVLPILLIILLGFGFQRRMKVDASTLNRVNLFLFVPALTLSRLAETTLSVQTITIVAVAVLLNAASLWLLCWIIGRLMVWDSETQATVTLGSMLGNSGNFGLPLIELVLGRQFVGYQALVLAFNNVLTFTVGVWLLARSKLPLAEAAKQVLSMPLIYAVLLGIFLSATQKTLPVPLLTSLRYLGDGLIPVALLTLGMQLAEQNGLKNGSGIILATVLRLIVSPISMLAIVQLLGIQPELARVLILGASVPTAINTALLAIELNVNPNLASAIVLATTLICPITVTFTAFLVTQ
ncbi:MAG: AEC family transporter [Armatimonadetes bacterium]|nr:AEC family transporter [Armatimonadota bacterium]MDW8028768.1 AEC family transporter [Armatimonadota bacterium]